MTTIVEKSKSLTALLVSLFGDLVDNDDANRGVQPVGVWSGSIQGYSIL